MREDIKPGIKMHSQEWFDITATNVPEPLRDAVERICTGWQIPDSFAPNMIAKMIEDSIRAVLGKTHTLAGDQVVSPIEVRFNGKTWSFVGEIHPQKGDEEDPNLIVYDTRDIEKATNHGNDKGNPDDYAVPA